MNFKLNYSHCPIKILTPIFLEKMLNNRRIIVNKLTSDFRAATKIVEEKIPAPGKREMIIKNTSVGINASDVNFSSGAYLPGIQPPFNCGFEAVGTVVAAGPGAQLKEGDHCVYSDYGAFSEYHTGIGVLCISPTTAENIFFMIEK